MSTVFCRWERWTPTPAATSHVRRITWVCLDEHYGTAIFGGVSTICCNPDFWYERILWKKMSPVPCIVDTNLIRARISSKFQAFEAMLSKELVLGSSLDAKRQCAYIPSTNPFIVLVSVFSVFSIASLADLFSSVLIYVLYAGTSMLFAKLLDAHTVLFFWNSPPTPLIFDKCFVLRHLVPSGPNIQASTHFECVWLCTCAC